MMVSCQFSGEGFLEDGLAEAGGALEVGRHHRLQLLHHAQPPLHFRYNPSLLGKGWKRNWKRFQNPEVQNLHRSTVGGEFEESPRRGRFEENLDELRIHAGWI